MKTLLVLVSLVLASITPRPVPVTDLSPSPSRQREKTVHLFFSPCTVWRPAPDQVCVQIIMDGDFRVRFFDPDLRYSPGVTLLESNDLIDGRVLGEYLFQVESYGWVETGPSRVIDIKGNVRVLWPYEIFIGHR